STPRPARLRGLCRRYYRGIGKGITPDNNAFVLLLRALGPRPSDTVRFPEAMFRRLGMEPLPDQGDYFISLEHYLRDTVGLKNKEALIQVLEQEQIARQRPWKAQEFPHLAAWLKVNEKPLALVAQAVQRPHYFRPWVRSGDEKKHVPLMQQSLPELGPIRALAQALLARAMLRTGQADYDSAWKDLLTVLRLSRRLGRSHCVEALTGLALESSALYGLPAYLEQARLRPEDWQGRLRDLQKLPPRTSLAEIVHLGERSLALDFCQELHRQGCELDGQDSSTFAAIYWQIQRAGFPWQRVLKELNYWYDQFAQALRQPDRTQRLRALASVENELHKTLEDTAETGLGRLLGAVIPQADPNLGERFSATLAALLFSSLQRVATAYDRVEQLHQLAQLAIALQIYRVENGEFPPRLQDLVPKYLPEVPNDVFSAQALVYRRTDRGYLLYSVGPNGKDEGGRTDQDKPRGDDLRIQLPAPPPNVRPIHLP
ncbi:MAG: hypothetical protein RMJ19_09105, partial [Gemmatales bacterium]|nr:hypothetical protein [Gemmatales bacterium]MDW8175818.1 hypothetical protein [Gemmatales bacterium]